MHACSGKSQDYSDFRDLCVYAGRLYIDRCGPAFHIAVCHLLISLPLMYR
uniref:Uncharacterized protein n=1 Tax=Parascaris equorum TaxID=6256 RepID=A0A914RKW2_PAREQ